MVKILDRTGVGRHAPLVCDVHTRMPDPLAPHTATPEELRARIDAERAGAPFLVLRDGDDSQRIVSLPDDRPARLSIGRNPSNDVSLEWDEEVSRLHAELERIGGEWTISDDGLSRNGTFVNGSRIGGRVRLRDGDVIRAGATAIAYRRPSAAEISNPTHVGVPRVNRDDLPATQRQVLVALARPFKHNEFAAPASNGQIADELHLSVDAVKAHLRMLFQRFGIEDLPPNQKRSRLVAEALQSGIVSQREL
jgi:pSer/pThr/pTyr-binding forkhead associated (FHA) protein